jgi:hypothetical protein
MKQKKNFQESNLWPHVSLLATLTFNSLPKDSRVNYINIVKQYTVLMHANISYYSPNIWQYICLVPMLKILEILFTDLS